MKIVAECIYDTLMNKDDKVVLQTVKDRVKELTTKYPLKYK
jgi:glycine/serine hydroxymethyltransferase